MGNAISFSLFRVLFGFRSPDIIFVAQEGEGNILTMEDSNPTAEAMAVTGDKITAVGRAEDILKTGGFFTKVVHLTGNQTLMPGLIEPHSHPDLLASREFTCDVSGFNYSSFTEIFPVMKQAVADAAKLPKYPTPWVKFVGWDTVLLDDLPELDADWLDINLTTEYPVFVLQAMGHSCWINHKALEVCKITKDTPDPAGGKIVRDSEGNPTGMLLEAPAIQLAAKHFPSPSLSKTREAFLHAFQQYSKCGITTVADLGTLKLNLSTLIGLSLLTYLRKFPVRLGVYYTPASPIKPVGRHIGKKLWFPGVKVWADGSPYTGTMACQDNYLHNSFTEKLNFEYPNGLLNYNNDKLYELLHPFNKELVAIHAHGERAVTQALDVCERIIREDPQRGDRRYRLEHCGLITEELMKRAATLGVTVTFYIDHVYYYGPALYKIIGVERASRFAPAGAAKSCGQQHWTLHQDSPFSPLDPFLCMKNAIFRKTRQGGSTLGQQYCITIDDALKAYTINAAWQLRREHEIGSLAVGKLADLALLSDNPRTVNPEDLTSIKAEATYLGGYLYKHI